MVGNIPSMKLIHGMKRVYSFSKFLFLYFSLAVQPVLQFLTPFRLPQYRPLLRRVNHPTERFSIGCYYRKRLSHPGGWGVTPSSSHNTSTGPRSPPGGIPVPGGGWVGIYSAMSGWGTPPRTGYAWTGYAAGRRLLRFPGIFPSTKYFCHHFISNILVVVSRMIFLNES